VPLDQFFGGLENTDEAQRFRQLRRVVETDLSGAKGLRLGSPKVDVYLVGRARSGAWVALHTRSVET
jgi:hypothetical protein